MSIWNKVFIGLILVLMLPFYYFAVRTMQTHHSWRGAIPTNRGRILDIEKRIAKNAKEIERLKFGDDDVLLAQGGSAMRGIARLDADYYKLTVDRKRVWYGVTHGPAPAANPAGAAPAPGSCTATFRVPDPFDPTKVLELDVESNMIVYVFEHPIPVGGGVYLGEFKTTVLDKPNGVVLLEPVLKMTPNEVAAVNNSAPAPVGGSNGTWWMVCEAMPVDRHDYFAGMTEAELRDQWMPVMGSNPALLEEYLQDGKVVGGDDDPARHIFGGKFVRPLRDYAVFFRELHRQMANLLDRVNTEKTEFALLTAGHGFAVNQANLRQQEINMALNPELVRLRKERDNVRAHHERLQTRLTETRRAIDTALATNKRLSERLTSMQFRLAAAIETEIESERVGAGDSGAN